ncbi:GDSL-type esterase/lipase family protein [Enterococcus sp. AZ102]|uniref:GDSL-type esterase/lipase family protein n=1 Tax=Enterococcus sp. AZ102 TaxID=2774865 RepID=UPI003F24A23C
MVKVDKIAVNDTLNDGREKINKAIDSIVNSGGNTINIGFNGTYDSLSALQSAYPSGDSGAYLVGTSDDTYHTFVYQNGVWQDKGPYQAKKIADNSISPSNLSETNKEMIVKTKAIRTLEVDFTTYTRDLISAVNKFVYVYPETLAIGEAFFTGIFIKKKSTVLLLKSTNGSDFEIVDSKIFDTKIGLDTIMTGWNISNSGYFLGIYADQNVTVKPTSYEKLKYLASKAALTSISNGTTFGTNQVTADAVAFFADSISDRDILEKMATKTIRKEFDSASQKTKLVNDAELGGSKLSAIDPDTFSSWGLSFKKQNVVFDEVVLDIQFDTQIANLKYMILDIRSTVNATKASTIEQVKIDVSSLTLTNKNTLTFKFANVYNLNDNLSIVLSSVDANNNLLKTSLGITMTKTIDMNLESTILFNAVTSAYPSGLATVANTNTKGYQAFPYALKYLNQEITAVDVVARTKLDELNVSELTSFNQLTFKDESGKYYLNGRWYQKNNYPTTINQGAQIFAKFSGSEIKGTFKTYGTPATVVAVKVDGLNYTRITTVDDTPIVLATGLSGGDHIIEIMMDGIKETLDGLWTSGNGASFKGFDIDTKAIQPLNKTILFIGDSITAGINVLAEGSNPAVNSAYQTYAQICANELNANQFRLGFGGTGVTKSGSGGVPKALDQIDYYYDNYKQDMPTPNIIVINHGTNDQGATNETFKNEYYKLILKLRSKFGAVPIVSMIPFGQYHRQNIEAVAALFKNVYVCQTSDWGVTYTDGVHPNVEGHKKAGAKLAERLLEIVDKSYFLY